MANIKRIQLPQFMRQLAATSRRPPAYKRMWRNHANKLEAFEQHLGKNVFSDSFNALLTEEYKYFLKSNKKEYKASTVKRFLERLGEALGKAAKSGYKVDFGFEEVETDDDETCTVYLDEIEIEKIFRLEKLSREAHAARERFIVACCTGMRFNDVKNVTSDNLLTGTIKMKTRKKIQNVEIPIHWMVRDVIKRNKGVLPSIKSEQAFNTIVKRICRKAGIVQNVLYERIHGLRMVRKLVKKYTLVSSHTGRRSLATNMYLAGIPVARIMLITGHTTEQSFFIYIRINKQENARILATHSFFTGIANFGIMETIGKQIAKRRKELGMTQKEFAVALQLSAPAIASYETGRDNPSIPVLNKMAALFNCELNIFFEKRQKKE